MNKSSFAKAAFQFFFLVSFLAGFWFLGAYLDLNEEQFRAFLGEFPYWGAALAFIGAYVIFQFFSEFSKDFLKPLALLFFGLWISSFLIWVAECINAAVWFWLTRKYGQDFVFRIFEGKWARFDQRVQNASWWDLFLLRALILIPYRVLDPAMGLTAVSFRKYFSAVLLGSPPRIILVQYFLLTLKEVLKSGPLAFADYATVHPELSWFSLAYLTLTGFLIWRVKKILWK